MDLIFDQFDALIYINLGHRLDRRLALLAHLTALHIPLELCHRIEATYIPENGHLGCLKSHMQALSFAKQFKAPLIVEDDIYPLHSLNTLIDTLTNAPPYDLFLLGGHILRSRPTSHPPLQRVTRARCAHAYAPAPHYIPTLLSHLQRATLPFDASWHPLQEAHQWFGAQLFHQQPGYSDIERADIYRPHFKVG